MLRRKNKNLNEKVVVYQLHNYLYKQFHPRLFHNQCFHNHTTKPWMQTENCVAQKNQGNKHAYVEKLGNEKQYTFFWIYIL